MRSLSNRHLLSRCGAVTVILAGQSCLGAHAQPAAPSAAGSSVAYQPQMPALGLITTHAESTQRLPNTVADAMVSIEVHGRDLRGTASALGQKSQTLLAYLRTQPTERLRSERMSFNPEMQEIHGQPDRINGYDGRLSISFRSTPDQLPALLAGCLDNGATTLGQFTASPREQEIAAARQAMLAEASQTALAQAKAIAGIVGQQIAGVEAVAVDPMPVATDQPVPAYLKRAAAPSAPVQPVGNEAGDSGVSDTVVMTLRLAPPI